MKRICVVDGQGGGIGSNIIRRLKQEFGETIEVTALGTNAIATTQMLKSKANRGASGENAIVTSIKKADAVIGPLSIIIPNALMGEVTVRIAEAIADCDAKKFLIPLFQENIEIVGVNSNPLPHYVEDLVGIHLKEFLK